MTTVTLKLPPLFPAQQKIWDCEARFVIAACGRRFGKTRLGALKCIVKASQRGRVWWTAPTYQLAAVGWREIRQLAAKIPYTIIKEGDKMVFFPGGGWVMVRSTDNPISLRSEGLDYLVMDEAAFSKPEAWHESLRPALADRQGSALFISSPNSRNWYFHLWLLGLTANNDGYKAFRYPTAANPFIAPAEIEAARQTSTARTFAAEWLADFTDDSAGVFRNIRACQYNGQETPISGRRYCLGVDLAMTDDYSVITVVDAETGRLVDIDRFNMVAWSIQRQRIQAMCERWQPSIVLVENNSIGGPNVEALIADGLPIQAFTTTNDSKAQLIEGLTYAFETGSISLPAQHPLYDTLVAELEAFEMDRLPSGRIRYGAPSGMHDDVVISLGLSWYAKQHYGGEIGRTVKRYA